MRKDNNGHLRPELEQMPTQQLNELLHKELEKESVDGDLVRLIMQLLEVRESKDEPELNEACIAAWEQFKANCAEDRKSIGSQPPARNRNWMVRAAAVAAALVILVFAVPAVSGAGNVVEMFSRWTGSIFDLFNPNAVQPAYVFKTEHQGLQQVYDTVSQLGITQPVVPMWIPDGYELVELKTTNTPSKVKVYAILAKDESIIVITVELYGTNTPHKYETEVAETTEVEIGEVTHYIERNDGAYVAVWFRDNLECSLTVDCQEDTLFEMLRSIYKMEVS